MALELLNFLIFIQIFSYFIKHLFAAPVSEAPYHQKRTCDACSGALYYCKKFDEDEYGCEMDNLRFGAVVIFAALTGIIFPIACISLYVCGFYSRIKHYLTSSVKRAGAGTEDMSLLERDFPQQQNHQKEDTMDEPSISQPSTESMKPIERKFKKNPNRFSQPQCELLSELGKRSASTDM